MKPRQLIFSWLVITLLGLGVVGAVTTSYLPKTNAAFSTPVADGFALAALYAGIFFLVFGLAMGLGYLIRFSREKTIYPSFHLPVLRQSSLFGIGATVLLALKGLAVFTWWDAALLIVALCLVELSFRVKPTIG